MFRDRITTGALIGLLADAVKLAFNYLAYKLGYAGAAFWRIAAAHFVRAEDLHDPLAAVIGAIADLTTAAALGIVFLSFISRTGRGQLWLKGVGFGPLSGSFYSGF